MSTSLRYRFGDHDSEVRFSSTVDPAFFSSDAGALVVFDRNTAGLQTFEHAGQRLVLAPGEGSKSWSGARRILQRALDGGLGRDGLIVGVGGGVVCDLAAFSASLFMRGCRLILVPTSLLAMVDAAIGGKTAINLGGYKNMAGTFYPAERVWINVSVLRHLPVREFDSGMGEVIKTALLGDRELLAILLEQSSKVIGRDPEVMEEIVRRCVAVKAGVVEGDPREAGNRAVLNLGHTFGHALEAETGYKLCSHGEAVAWGLMQAAVLSRTLGLADPGYTATVRELLETYGFEMRFDRKPESIVKAMEVDKKKRRGKLRLVLQRGIGDTVVREVDPHLIVETLQHSARIFP